MNRILHTERTRQRVRRGVKSMFSPSEYSRVWDSILDAVKESGELSTTALDFWFRNVKIVYIDDASVVFSVENELKKDNILERYAKVLADCTASVVGGSPTIELIVEKISPQPLEGEGRVTSPLSRAKEIELEKKREKEENMPPFLMVDQVARQKNQAGGGEQRLTYNPEYTFDNFIVGNSNKFAHAAALAVANNPAATYNPLFLYGPSGLGKTHLMYAITNKLLERSPNMNAIYITGEDFTNQLIECIAHKENTAFREAFREKYRKADILLIDDIQFIAGKESTQWEFFHTFNALYSDHKQIILTSDRPPRDIKTLEDRLKTRFEWGLIADIQPPDLELRIAIIKKKIEQAHIRVPDDVILFLAENLRSNIRQIEGAIRKLSALSFLNGKDISMELARNCISELLGGAEPVNVTVDKIFAAVFKKYNVRRDDLVGARRTKEVASARHITIYLIRKITDMSFPNIGKIFSRDHSTIMSSIETVEKKIQHDSVFNIEINELIKEVNGQ